MKAAQPSGFETSRAIEGPTQLRAQGGNGTTRPIRARPETLSEIVKNLTAWSGIELGDVLIYATGNGQAETRP